MGKGILLAIVAVLIIGAAGAGCSYNKFVGQEQTVKTEWGEVENQMQRRHDLIPNLVETTKGLAQQEKDVFQAIADARAKMAGATTPEARMAGANAESSALARLLVVVENYPTLKSDQAFLTLMTQLEGTENRLAASRGRYNTAVGVYNRMRLSFPSNITAKLFGFKEYTNFEAPAEAKTAPKVDFGKGK